MSTQQPWNKEAIHDEEFAPLVAKLIALSKKHDMPLLLSVQYAQDEHGGKDYSTTRCKGDASEWPAAFLLATCALLEMSESQIQAYLFRHEFHGDGR